MLAAVQATYVLMDREHQGVDVWLAPTPATVGTAQAHPAPTPQG